MKYWVSLENNEYIIKEVDISDILAGDTIAHNGIIKTVSEKNIIDKNSELSIFGDSYNLGYKKVKKVLYPYFSGSDFLGYR